MPSRLLLVLLLIFPQVLLAASFANSTLQGNFVFSYGGFDTNGVLLVAGAFTADGNGRITTGLLDVNSGAGVFPSISFTGVYSLDFAGHGTAVLTTSGTSLNLRFVMVSSDRAKLIDFDNLVLGSGEMERRVDVALSNSLLSGDYVYFFDGISSTGWVALAGHFTADGNGGVSAGVQDSNDSVAGTAIGLPYSGSYSLASNGRGTFTTTSQFGATQFAFYPVSANKAKLISMQLTLAVLGDAEKQLAPSFSNSTLVGDYAFFERGYDSVRGWEVVAGRFSSDGAGVISNGAQDVNDAGAVTLNLAFTGSYGTSNYGRAAGTLTSQFGSSLFVLYLVSGHRFKFLSLDQGIAAGGSGEAQETGLTTASLAGTYAYLSDGFTGNSPVAIAGFYQPDGLGNMTDIGDRNLAGSLASALALSGSYNLSSNGRGTATLGNSTGTLHFSLYAGSSGKFFFAGMDSYAVISGIAEKQAMNAPVSGAGGLVNGASFAAGLPVSAGSIVSLFGTSFSDANTSSSSLPLPRVLGGAAVLVNGIPAPLFFVSPGQINFQFPWEAAGPSPVSVTVTTTGGTSSQTISLGAVSPGIFTINPAGQGAILIAATGEIAASADVVPGRSRPANRGEFLSIYCTGLGAVSNQPQTGAASPGNPLPAAAVLPTVSIGGVQATPDFAGLAPGFVGLYQINVKIPSNVSPGSAVPVTITSSGVTSNQAAIAVN